MPDELRGVVMKPTIAFVPTTIRRRWERSERELDELNEFCVKAGLPTIEPS